MSSHSQESGDETFSLCLLLCLGPGDRRALPATGVGAGVQQRPPGRVRREPALVQRLHGLPSSYQSGQTYPLTVRLRDPGQQRWGFELTVLDDADFYAQGGSLAVTDSAHTQLSEDYEGTEDYLKHTLNGTYNGTPDGPVTWDFDWTAPDPGVSSVTFYVVGNAANGDFDSTGDYIYASSFPLEAGPPVPTISTTWGRVKSLYHGR
jgi:hypothetical protein